MSGTDGTPVPDAFVRFNRAVKNTTSAALQLFVITASSRGMRNKLEPPSVSYRLFTEGATLNRKAFKSQQADPQKPFKLMRRHSHMQ